VEGEGSTDTFPHMSAPASRAMAEFAASRHGLIARSQAAAFGLTPRDIRLAKERGWLTEPARGLLVLSGYPPTWEQRLAIVTATSASRPLVSDGAASRLFALDGFASAGPELTVLRPGRVAQDAAGGIVVHQTSILDPCDRYMRNGLPCTSLARTLADLGSRHSADTVWRALISARRIHRVNPLWLQQTAVRLHRPGQTGTGMLMRALRRWSAEGTLPDSWFEELLRRMLDHPEIPTITPQCVIADEAGKFVARVDLGIPAVRLGIEGHSRGFHFGPMLEAADEDRDLRATACGWELIYLGWYAQRRPTEVVQIIAKICRARLERRSA
jgi:hypothetical protein